MKKHLEDLALLGGRPAFQDKIHVGRPNIGRRESFIERTITLLDRKWLTNNGPFVQEFERTLAGFLGVRHFVAVCNGTIALELAIQALELKGEVILPSFTFIATAHALRWHDVTPVFCDIDPSTHDIDPRRVEALITPRTTGIMGVHLWGKPCAVEALSEISHRHDLKLVFDAAHAFACSYRGRMIGSFGDAEAFSFHATKFFNTFEGGGIATNDDELANRVRLMKNFGFAGYDKVVGVGTNGKMSEICAAMGLTGLESIDEFIAHNYRNYRQYLKEFGNMAGVSMFRYDESEKCNYQYIVLEIDDENCPISRDELVEILWAENVIARRYFYPGCHLLAPYSARSIASGVTLPQTERLARRILVLPTGTAVGPNEISQICQIVRSVLDHGTELRKRIDEQNRLSPIKSTK